jgi:hypothetical protein
LKILQIYHSNNEIYIEEFEFSQNITLPQYILSSKHTFGVPAHTTKLFL